MYVGRPRRHQLRCGTKSLMSKSVHKNVHYETQLLSKVEGIGHCHVCEHVSSLLFDSLGFCLKINNTHEKLLDSDWLRAVQFKFNTRANYTS